MAKGDGMTARVLSGGALLVLLALGVLGCGDNSGSPTGFRPDGHGDAALLFLDVQPDAPDSSTVAVFGDIYDASAAR